MKQPTTKAAMPDWMTRDDKGVFHVDPDVAYPAILKAAGLDKLDQYSLEVAYQVAKLKTQDVAAAMGHDSTKQTLVIVVEPKSQADKKKWALANYPKGRGIEAATKGLEAKQHYARIRHLL